MGILIVHRLREGGGRRRDRTGWKMMEEWGGRVYISMEGRRRWRKMEQEG